MTTNAHYTFLSWYRTGLATAIDATAADMRGEIEVVLTAKLGAVEQAQPGQKVRLIGPGDIIGLDARSVVRTDPRFLEETLVGLIDNARDASADRRAPRIATRNASGTDVRAEHGRNYLVIAVTDTGEGMSEETRHQAFDLFFSARAQEAHRGIGLAQAKDTARRTGGLASIESRVGEGTTITLAIPLEETA